MPPYLRPVALEGDAAGHAEQEGAEARALTEPIATDDAAQHRLLHGVVDTLPQLAAEVGTDVRLAPE